MNWKRLRRIFGALVIALVLIIASVFYLAPVALSFYAARKAVPVTRVVPKELPDRTISQAKAVQLSFVGCGFEVPWNDLDESKTLLYPKDKPAKTRAVLFFPSGLRMMVTSYRPRESTDLWETELKVPAQNIEAIFGPGSSTSDYIFTRSVYSFTPDNMHHWSLTPTVYARETVLLIAKSLMPSRPAQSGIFNVQTDDYRGFQQGNLNLDREGAIVTLFANDGGVEFVFDAMHYTNPSGLTQPEINRIVQTLRKVPNGKSSTPQTGTSS
jgi:hypothetical protein